ncbi:hypothetical protein [Desulfoplanes sp.]
MKKSANRKQWAARSAIQKAIRRSDQGMFRAAFTILWDMDRSWLLWRLSILAIEEIWQHAGTARTLLATIKESGTPASFRTEVHDFLQRLCLSAKDHSTYVLLVLLDLHAHGQYGGPKQDPYKRRWNSLVRMLTYRHEHGDGAVAAAVLDKAEHLESPDAAEAAKGCMDRFAIKGGMDGDRTMALIGGFLALTSYAGPPPPAQPTNTQEPSDWPWWVYDHHTTVGKTAFPSLARDLGMSKTDLTRLSFAFTGGVRTPISPDAFWPQELDRVHNQIRPGRQDQWKRVRHTIRQGIVDQVRRDPLEQPLSLPFV